MKQDRTLSHIILTGANGYIGVHLLKRLLDQNVQVTALVRDPSCIPPHPALRTLSWSLGEPVPQAAFQGISADALIHLAHHWQLGPDHADPNRIGTQELLDAARRHKIGRFVFASTVSARQNALNRYGKIKCSIETLLNGNNEVAARIGLVYGGPRQGLWGQLCRIAGLTPLLPMVEAGHPNQPIHIDDLCDGLVRLAEMPTPNRRYYVLADASPVPFGMFLQMIANHTLGRHLLIFPISFSMVMAAFDFLEKIPGMPTINRERLLGLAGIPTLNSAPDLEELGLSLRPLAEGLACERADRSAALLNEGRVLLRYLGISAPSQETLNRYVQGLAHSGEQFPLLLPPLAAWIPTLLSVFEPVGHSGSPLAGRLNLALRLAETEREGARRMYAYSPCSRSALLTTVVLVGLREILLLSFRLVLGHKR